MHNIIRALVPTAAFGLLFVGLRRSNRQQGRINGALSRAVLTAEEHRQAIWGAIRAMAAEVDLQDAAQWQRIGSIAAVTAELSSEVYSIREAVEGPSEAVRADA